MFRLHTSKSFVHKKELKSNLTFQSCDNDPNDPDMHEAWKQEGLHESIVDDDDDEDFRDSIDVSVNYEFICDQKIKN